MAKWDEVKFQTERARAAAGLPTYDSNGAETMGSQQGSQARNHAGSKPAPAAAPPFPEKKPPKPPAGPKSALSLLVVEQGKRYEELNTALRTLRADLAAYDRYSRLDTRPLAPEVVERMQSAAFGLDLQLRNAGEARDAIDGWLADPQLGMARVSAFDADEYARRRAELERMAAPETRRKLLIAAAGKGLDMMRGHAGGRPAPRASGKLAFLLLALGALAVLGLVLYSG